MLPPGCTGVSILSKRSRSSSFSEASMAAVLMRWERAVVLTVVLISAAVPTKPMVRTSSAIIVSMRVKPRSLRDLRGDINPPIVRNGYGFLRQRRIGEGQGNWVYWPDYSQHLAAGIELNRDVAAEGYSAPGQRNCGQRWRRRTVCG